VVYVVNMLMMKIETVESVSSIGSSLELEVYVCLPPEVWRKEFYLIVGPNVPLTV